ncbi:hypothetical protein H9L39_11750 [Fusarium oxysporum f. sp. albedinis]|nr:hypothetical protein H9L39_11750 [Fusarium oxysporum f. sp. albedinis]
MTPPTAHYSHNDNDIPTTNTTLIKAQDPKKRKVDSHIQQLYWSVCPLGGVLTYTEKNGINCGGGVIITLS